MQGVLEGDAEKPTTANADPAAQKAQWAERERKARALFEAWERDEPERQASELEALKAALNGPSALAHRLRFSE